ncbi:MBL fold metallo-hydrolase [Mesorhizobium sp. INR15]|uniref:MBL fold metallo-hydrolase n=1 Tax=Mesorhizobium sp. INR15 TaxID=2654248 RepID=UPI0021560DDA|nr:MBL fold metallo-hydrolase [Mesorhizobium sp. INR15]
MLHDYNTNTLKSAGLSSKDGGRPIPDSLDTGVILITKDNVDKVLTALKREIGRNSMSRSLASGSSSVRRRDLPRRRTANQSQGYEMALHPTTRMRFHGVAAYEILTRDGLRILCDPFLDQNPGAATKSTDFDHVDLVIVSHAAFDHLGDTDKIAAKYGCPIVCGGEVKAWLMDRGIPANQIRATTWGIRVKVAGIEIQPLECHHWSQIRLKDNSFISGVPMAFIVYADDQSALLPLRRHGHLFRPQASGRTLQAECRLYRNRQSARDSSPEPNAGRDADRRDEPL